MLNLYCFHCEEKTEQMYWILVATVLAIIAITIVLYSWPPKNQTFPEATHPLSKDYNIIIDRISWNVDWVNVTWTINDNTKPLYYVDSAVNNTGTIMMFREIVSEPFDGSYYLYKGDSVRVRIHNTSSQPFSSNMAITQLFNFDGEYQLLNFTTN